jgi:hypothetical protein
MKYIIGLSLAAVILTGCVDEHMYRHTEQTQVKKDSEHHERDRSEHRDREHDEHHE